MNGQRGSAQTNYSTAKAGMHGFNDGLAQEVASKGRHRQYRLAGIYRDGDGACDSRRCTGKIVSTIPVKRLGKARGKSRVNRRGWFATDAAGFATGDFEWRQLHDLIATVPRVAPGRRSCRNHRLAQRAIVGAEEGCEHQRCGSDGVRRSPPTEQRRDGQGWLR